MCSLAGKSAVDTWGSTMSCLKLMWLANRSLHGLSLVGIVAVAAGCQSSGTSLGVSSTPIKSDVTHTILGLGNPLTASPSSLPFEISGTGSTSFAGPFSVSTDTLTVRYSYDCSSTGGSGFIAGISSGNQLAPSYDYQSIANVAGVKGAATVTLHPRDVGQDYYLQVGSACRWQIGIAGG